MGKRFNAWRMAKVRYIGWGPKPLVPYHITFTPKLGFSLPWFGKSRIRWAPHHGLQLVESNGHRWVVRKQVLGTSSLGETPTRR